MNEENKYKLVFGKEVAQKEYMNLQNDSKIFKPASFNRLLRKRSWKLDQIPQTPFNQKNDSMKKLKRSLSLEDSASSLKAEKTHKEQILLNSFHKIEKVVHLDSEQNKHQKFNQQLRISRPGLSEFATANNVEDYFAYNLGNFYLSCFLLIGKRKKKIKNIISKFDPFL